MKSKTILGVAALASIPATLALHVVDGVPPELTALAILAEVGIAAPAVLDQLTDLVGGN